LETLKQLTCFGVLSCVKVLTRLSAFLKIARGPRHLLALPAWGICGHGFGCGPEDVASPVEEVRGGTVCEVLCEIAKRGERII
jgi:hypothetical protein